MLKNTNIIVAAALAALTAATLAPAPGYAESACAAGTLTPVPEYTESACVLPIASISVGPTLVYGADVGIVDADTIRIGDERIRLLDVDAPESWRSRCANELVVALQAKERLRELIAAGPIRIERHGRDRYARTLAKVFASDGREVGETLVSEGLAIEWKPGKAAWRARALHWCPGFAEE